MKKELLFVGLDVHAKNITIAINDLSIYLPYLFEKCLPSLLAYMDQTWKEA